MTARARFRVEVIAQRGDQPAYHYTVSPVVKPGKVQRLIDRTALDIAAHEGRSGMVPRFYWGEDFDGFATVRIIIEDNVFIVLATPVIGA